MRAAGEGGELYCARVDLFADVEEPNSVVPPCADALCDLLGIARGKWERGEIGVDRGIGVEGSPVVGFLFWVRGEDIGDAARTAVRTARAAGAPFDVGPRLYDVSLIPSAAVILPDKPFPRLPD
jgi:hypothetical protein